MCNTQQDAPGGSRAADAAFVTVGGKMTLEMRVRDASGDVASVLRLWCDGQRLRFVGGLRGWMGQRPEAHRGSKTPSKRSGTKLQSWCKYEKIR